VPGLKQPPRTWCAPGGELNEIFGISLPSLAGRSFARVVFLAGVDEKFFRTRSRSLAQMPSTRVLRRSGENRADTAPPDSAVNFLRLSWPGRDSHPNYETDFPERCRQGHARTLIVSQSEHGRQARQLGRTAILDIIRSLLRLRLVFEAPRRLPHFSTLKQKLHLVHSCDLVVCEPAVPRRRGDARL
jgi:hypothetical protein